MKKKLSEWSAIYRAISQIPGLPPAPAFRIGKMQRAIHPSIIGLEAEQNKLLEKYGAVAGTVPKEAYDAFNKEHKPLLEEEVELDMGNPVFLSAIPGVAIPPWVYQVMDGLFEDK